MRLDDCLSDEPHSGITESIVKHAIPSGSAISAACDAIKRESSSKDHVGIGMGYGKRSNEVECVCAS
jgi:hypothetical protein